MPHLHNCYFHDHNIITHFCTRPECTLPMCDKCLPIHLQEHPTTIPQNQGVISFNEAEERAIQGLKKTLSAQSITKTLYINKMQEFKTRLMELVDQFVTGFKTQIDQECECITEIQRKLTKIQKGSLKTLIYFYTEQEKSINKATLDLKAAQLERIHKSFLRIVEQQKSPQPERLTAVHQQKISQPSPREQNKKSPTFQYQGRERGYSMSILNNKTSMDRSSSYQKFQKIQKVENTHQNKYSYNETNLRMKSDASFKALPRTFVQRQESNTNKVNKGYLYTETNQYTNQMKTGTQSERQRQIQNIRQREEQRQRDKQRQKQIQSIRLRQEQKQRERQRQKQEKQRKLKLQMERQKQKQRENQYALMRMNQKVDYQKNKIEEHHLQNEKNIRLSDRAGHGYQFQELEKSSAGNYKKDNSIYIRNQVEVAKKPLEVSDLNIETKYSMYAKGFTEVSQQENKATKFNDNGFPINKQVLSPDQIRKMLQKRIEQRSRLITKNKSVSLLKNTEQSVSKSMNKSKDVAIVNNYGLQMEGRWDTKDSIINQIYEDYRF